MVPGPWREIERIELHETKTSPRIYPVVVKRITLRAIMRLKTCGHTVTRHLGTTDDHRWDFQNIPKKVRCEVCWELAQTTTSATGTK